MHYVLDTSGVDCLEERRGADDVFLIPRTLFKEAIGGRNPSKNFRRVFSKLLQSGHVFEVLHEIDHAAFVDPSSLKSNKDLIDIHLTRGFNLYFSKNLNDTSVSSHLDRLILESADIVRPKDQALLNHAPNFKEAVRDFQNRLNKTEIAAFRKHQRMGDGILSFIAARCYSAAQSSIEPKESAHQIGLADLRKTLVFRFMLVVQCYALHYLSVGGYDSRRVDRIVNDNIDILHTSIATYFDGVVSKDSTLCEIFALADFTFRNLSDGIEFRAN